MIPPRNLDDENREDRLQGTETWCNCGHCTVMPTQRECLCCHEVAKIDRRRKKGSEQPTFITLKQGFQSVCLDPDV
ncbi:hypothetical protein HOLleu_12401 [Holothuria leucospilota]|uniref:Uncharacterized protein n=1 Tax=Holothuria leucospilota TaxID=206669 RepID=A0A9Q1HCY2_HOLLE|nr:hypothetical protein HOLleu_12401 [Holothuria leucospilota]